MKELDENILLIFFLIGILNSDIYEEDLVKIFEPIYCNSELFLKRLKLLQEYSLVTCNS